MKKNVFLTGIIALACGVTSMTAQVGINTDEPSNKGLHIVQSGDTTGTANHGQAFRLEDGNQGEGKVLTSDASGNATWKAPLLTYTPTPSAVSTTIITTPSISSDALRSSCDSVTTSASPNYLPIGGNTFKFYFPLTNTDGSIYTIDFPQTGTYFVSMQLNLIVVNLPITSIDVNDYLYAIVQLKPTSSVLDWPANTPDKRFTGQYEVFAIPGNETSNQTTLRLVVNQMIQVTETTGLKGYLQVTLNFACYPQGTANTIYVPLPSTANPITVRTYIGNSANPSQPQMSGGAYVRIADVI